MALYYKAFYFIWSPAKEMVICVIARRTGCIELTEECCIQLKTLLKGFSWVILIVWDLCDLSSA